MDSKTTKNTTDVSTTERLQEDLPVKMVLRLNNQEYLKLEKIVSRTTLSDTSTPIQAAHALGVQHVLRVLREGFVV